MKDIPAVNRTSTAADWLASNPILAKGEIGLESDTGIIKRGDGVTSWVSLGAIGGDTITSASFATELIGETGTGSVVYSNSPTLVAPTLGAATVTSINGEVPVSLLALQSFTNQLSTGVDVMDRQLNVNNQVVISGTIYLEFFTPVNTLTVSQITMINNTTASSGLTLCRMGLYSFDETTATLVAQTASDTTLFNSSATAYTRSFSTAGGYPATYQLVAGTRYALGFICVGTTMPTFAVASPAVGANLIAPKIYTTKTAQTDLATPITVFTNAGFRFFGRFS